MWRPRHFGILHVFLHDIGSCRIIEGFGIDVGVIEISRPCSTEHDRLATAATLMQFKLEYTNSADWKAIGVKKFNRGIENDAAVVLNIYV